jgi:hypothetical protein
MDVLRFECIDPLHLERKSITSLSEVPPHWMTSEVRVRADEVPKEWTFEPKPGIRVPVLS